MHKDMPHNKKLCLVTMRRFSLQEAVMFVNYYLNIGINHIIIYFDDPDDEAIDVLSKHEEVISIRCDTKYWADKKVGPDTTHVKKQEINAGAGLELARALGCDWIIHVDQDELVHCDENLRTVLSRVDNSVDFVRFLPYEALPEKDEYSHPFEEIKYFRVLPTRRKRLLAYALFCKGAFVDGNYFRGHTLGKCATRISPRIAGLKPHFPVARSNDELNSLILPEVKLLHFDNMGFEAWKEKWIVRTVLGASSCGMRDHRGYQLEEFKKAYDKKDMKMLRELYQRLYPASGFQRYVLSRLGLLEEIRLDKELFKAHHGLL